MLCKVLPILLALIGLGGGVGAGWALRPAAEITDMSEGGGNHQTPAPASGNSAEPGHGATADGHGATDEHGITLERFDYVKLNNQFVVPIVEDGKLVAMAILGLSVEVTAGQSSSVYSREPKLRDAFLQVMFDHANSGGFRGDFTQSANMFLLRSALKEAATKTVGAVVSDVLILDIARRDV